MKLHNYQEMCRDFLRQQPRAALFLNLGLGKTAIVLSAFAPEHFPALVVAPKRVAEHVWPAEHVKWAPDLSLSVAIGEPKKRRAALDEYADVTVISQSNIGDLNRTYRTVVLDELSGYRDHTTTRFKLARKFCRKAEAVWGLTGTPTPQGLLDLWSQFILIDGGLRLGTRLTDYRGRYFIPTDRLPTGQIIGWEPREEAPDAIHRLLEDICLSIEDDAAVTLPPVTYNIVEFDLPPAVRKVYRDLKKDLVADLDLLGGGIHTAANAAVMTGKLSQITAGFLYADGGTGEVDRLHDLKVDAVREIADGTGDNLLVYYRFTEELRALRQAFPDARGVDEPGALGDWDAGKVSVLLAQPSSASKGLNLQNGGHTVVWATPTWDLEEWLQGNGRVLRQGQRHPVVIHTVEAAATVDGIIRNRITGKKFTQDALLDHVRSPV